MADVSGLIYIDKGAEIDEESSAVFYFDKATKNKDRYNPDVGDNTDKTRAIMVTVSPVKAKTKVKKKKKK